MQRNCKVWQRYYNGMQGVQEDTGCERELQRLTKVLQGDAGCARELQG